MGRAAAFVAALALAPVALASDACPPLGPGPGEGVEALGWAIDAVSALADSEVALRARVAADALCRPKDKACREARGAEAEASYRELVAAAKDARGAHLDLVTALDLGASCRSARDAADTCASAVPDLIAERRAAAVRAAKRLAREARNVSAAKQ